MKKRDDEQRLGELICFYPAAVKDGAITAHIPLRCVRWTEQGVADVRFRANNAR